MFMKDTSGFDWLAFENLDVGGFKATPQGFGSYCAEHWHRSKPGATVAP
jgi:hypothetical protein